MMREKKGSCDMKEASKKRITLLRQRIFRMVSVGVVDDPINQSYDIVSTLALLVNLVAAFAVTFDNVRAVHGPLLARVEAVTVFFFAVDYVLRLFTANNLYPDLDELHSLRRYMLSFDGSVCSVSTPTTIPSTSSPRSSSARSSSCSRRFSSSAC